jgi:phosphoribosylformylglycinamidine synthase PurS subunit
MNARVFVNLKPGVLDPAAKAVQGGLHSMGFTEVQSLRLGKVIDLKLEDRPDAEERLKAMCEKLLANTVIESYRIEIGD